MKSARIIAQEIAEILKGDVVAAVQVKEHFAEGELMALLGLTDTVAAARIEELKDEITDMGDRIDEFIDEVGDLKTEIAELKANR